MGRPEIEALVTHLATQEHVAASTQNQALAMPLFSYRHVLHRDEPALFESLNMARDQRPAHRADQRRSDSDYTVRPRRISAHGAQALWIGVG